MEAGDNTASAHPDQAPGDSEERFRSVFVSAVTPFVLTDLQGRLTRVNGAFCDLLGYEEPELLGRHWRKIVHSEDADELLAVSNTALGDGSRDLQMEARLIRSDGSIAWTLIDASILAGPDGEPDSFFALAHDVTERYQAEQALRESEERYRHLFERIPVALYRSKPDGEIVDGNSALAELLGCADIADLRGRNAGEFYLDEEERDRVTQQLAKDGVLLDVESRLRRADGEEIWVRDSMRIVGSGDDVFYEGALVDVTERRGVETELRARASQQEAAALLGQAALESVVIEAAFSRATEVVVAVLDVAMSAVFRRESSGTFKPVASHGWPSAAEVVTRSLAARTLEADSPIVLHTAEEVRLAVPELADAGFESAVSVTVAGADSPPGVLWAFADRRRDFSADDVHFLVSVANVLAAAGDRHEARHRLEQLIRSKDEFIASVSHELRTPLTVVTGMAHELQDGWDAFDSEEMGEYISLLVDQSRDMTDLIEDLLVAARADIGKVTVKLGEVEVSREVESVLSSFKDGDRARMRVRLADARVYADPVRFRQILRNLLTNAVRYGGAEIAIEIIDGTRTASILVMDDGAGIPEEDWERVFEPYHRAHNVAGQPSSVGLGLTVSRTLAKLMGGALSYQYRGGSVFELTLPRAVEPRRRIELTSEVAADQSS